MPEYTSFDLINFKFDFWALPKAVAGVKPHLRRIINPIRLQPFDNIVMAGEQNNLPNPAPPRLAERLCADFCNLAVNGRHMPAMFKYHTQNGLFFKNFNRFTLNVFVMCLACIAKQSAQVAKSYLTVPLPEHLDCLAAKFFRIDNGKEIVPIVELAKIAYPSRDMNWELWQLYYLVVP